MDEKTISALTTLAEKTLEYKKLAEEVVADLEKAAAVQEKKGSEYVADDTLTKSAESVIAKAVEMGLIEHADKQVAIDKLASNPAAGISGMNSLLDRLTVAKLGEADKTASEQPDDQPKSMQVWNDTFGFTN